MAIRLIETVIRTSTNIAWPSPEVVGLTSEGSRRSSPYFIDVSEEVTEDGLTLTKTLVFGDGAESMIDTATCSESQKALRAALQNYMDQNNITSTTEVITDA
jgi:hypothetical protein